LQKCINKIDELFCFSKLKVELAFEAVHCSWLYNHTNGFHNSDSKYVACMFRKNSLL
jgi:hypothetical protein